MRPQNKKKRIVLAKKAFAQKKNMLTNKTLSINTRKRFIRCSARAVRKNGYGSWTQSKRTEAQLWRCGAGEGFWEIMREKNKH